MQYPKSEKERPTAREQALARREFDMREVLGMRHLSPIVLDPEEKTVLPTLKASE